MSRFHPETLTELRRREAGGASRGTRARVPRRDWLTEPELALADAIASKVESGAWSLDEGVVVDHDGARHVDEAGRVTGAVHRYLAARSEPWWPFDGPRGAA
jgi:hypothetical protein